MSVETLIVNLILKPGKELKLTFDCTFMEDPFEAVVRENNTIEEIKEIISEISGIPSLLIHFGVAYSEKKEKLFICEYMKTVNHNILSVPFHVTKRVFVSLDSAGQVTKEYYPLRRYEDETVEDLRQFLKDSHPRCKVMLQNGHGFVKDTLLKDVGETVILFSIVKNDQKCILS